MHNLVNFSHTDSTNGGEANIWDNNPNSKSYGILIAFYTFHIARMISLIDSFIHILQGKPTGSHLTTAGLAYAMGPIYTWVCARFAKKEPSFDLELVLIAFTHCMVYLYYLLVVTGRAMNT